MKEALKKHKKVVVIPVVELDEAFKYNPSFGMTYQILNNEKVGWDYFLSIYI